MITSIYNQNSLYQYYCQYLLENTNHQLLNQQEFTQKIINEKLLLVSIENSINGFVSCSFQDTNAYITLNYGKIETKRKLIKRVEEVLSDYPIKQLWIHFFNPVRIPFYPLEGISHPGIQGVEYQSLEYNMYKDLGYCDNSLQNTYYLSLDNYESNYIHYPNDPIAIEIYDSNKHKGLYDFACKLNSENWKNEIVNNEHKNKPLPLLVAVDNNVVMGFTGPMTVSDSGRGYFAGIGVLPEYQGLKIGTYLFHNLCDNLKKMGAKYMTLFTGDTNKAKYIYSKAGFQIVSTQMTMKKRIGSDSREV